MRVVGPFTPNSPAEAAAIVRHYFALIDGQAVPPLPISDIPAPSAVGTTGLGNNRRRLPPFPWLIVEEAIGGKQSAAGSVPTAAAMSRPGGAAPPTAPTTAGGAAASAATPIPGIYARAEDTPKQLPGSRERAIVAALAAGAEDWAHWCLTESTSDSFPPLIETKP